MGNQAEDTKLARRLQKRGVYPNYTACLEVVRRWLRDTELTRKELFAAIDEGKLDP